MSLLLTAPEYPEALNDDSLAVINYAALAMTLTN